MVCTSHIVTHRHRVTGYAMGPPRPGVGADFIVTYRVLLSPPYLGGRWKDPHPTN